MFLLSREKICSAPVSRITFICSVFVFAFMVTTMLHFGSENFSLNYRRLFLERPQPRGGLLPQRGFTHLQPLVDMFANLTQVTPGRSDCMVSTTEFSDLKEPETKQTILLLIIVSTAPSRQERREAIRQTWWTKCHGEVSISWLENKVVDKFALL